MQLRNDIQIYRRPLTARPLNLVVEDHHFRLDSCRYVALDPVDVGILFLPSTKSRGHAFCADDLGMQWSGRGGFIVHDPEFNDTLVTVIDGSGINGDIDKKWLEEFVRETETNDVVFNKAFMCGFAIIQGTQKTLNVLDEAYDYLNQLGNGWISYSSVRTEHLSPGLYFFHKATLRPVCRYFSDHQKAFLTALRPRLTHGRTEAASSHSDTTFHDSKRQKLEHNPSRPFQPFNTTGEEYNTLAIAVPSRLTTHARRTNPPLRIAVKDVFSIHGLKTSLCNTAYYRVSEPATSTAFVVQALADQGHHILGLTKLSSLIAREEPMDAVDFQSAFNPRSDGYQSPAGSSSGSATAVAAYDWLDCAIGTTAAGSGRRPALVNGVFQFRPSHDSVMSLGGMVQTFPWFDTPVVFARSLSVLERVSSAWLPHERVEGFWGRINVMYPREYLHCSTIIPAQLKLIDEFVDDLAKWLKCSVTKMSLIDSWQESPPDGADPNIKDYLQNVIAHTCDYSYYHLTSGWVDKYKDRFGHEPYVIPFVKQRWDTGNAVTDQQHEEALRKLEIYRKWLLEILLLTRGNRTLVILPIAPAEPRYRDERTKFPQCQSANNELFLSPILKAPDVVVPIGEVPYDSRITGRREWLPVCVNLVGAPGMDKWLLDAVAMVLKKSGRPDTVSSGSRIFGNRE